MTIGPLTRMTAKTIGNMKVHALLDAVGPTRLPADLILDLPADVVANNATWLIPDYIDPVSGHMIMAYTSYLIQLDGRAVLVDCAVGEDGNFPGRADWHLGKSNWMNHLGLAGLSPEEIDIVFLTHLHVDHTGWLTRKTSEGWQPSFPEARHLASPVELDFWPENHGHFGFMATSFRDSVKPVLDAGLFSPVAPETELLPGLFVVDLAGHSPGMLGLEYRQGDKVLAAFTADMMHHPIQMAAPQCSTGFCSDPAGAARLRKRKLSQYARDETLMFCNHFPGESAGLAVPAGDGFQFQPVR